MAWPQYRGEVKLCRGGEGVVGGVGTGGAVQVVDIRGCPELQVLSHSDLLCDRATEYGCGDGICTKVEVKTLLSKPLAVVSSVLSNLRLFFGGTCC